TGAECLELAPVGQSPAADPVDLELAAALAGEEPVRGGGLGGCDPPTGGLLDHALARGGGEDRVVVGGGRADHAPGVGGGLVLLRCRLVVVVRGARRICECGLAVRLVGCRFGRTFERPWLVGGTLVGARGRIIDGLAPQRRRSAGLGVGSLGVGNLGG